MSIIFIFAALAIETNSISLESAQECLTNPSEDVILVPILTNAAILEPQNENDGSQFLESSNEILRLFTEPVPNFNELSTTDSAENLIFLDTSAIPPLYTIVFQDPSVLITDSGFLPSREVAATSGDIQLYASERLSEDLTEKDLLRLIGALSSNIFIASVSAKEEMQYVIPGSYEQPVELQILCSNQDFSFTRTSLEAIESLALANNIVIFSDKKQDVPVKESEVSDNKIKQESPNSFCIPKVEIVVDPSYYALNLLSSLVQYAYILPKTATLGTLLSNPQIFTPFCLIDLDFYLTDPLKTDPDDAAANISLSPYTFFQTPESLCPHIMSAQEEAEEIKELRVSYVDEKGDIVLNSEDISKELGEWGDLLEVMRTNETVFIGETTVSFSEAEKEVSILEDTLKIMEDRKNVLVISDGEAKFEEPVVTNSDELTGQAFEAFTEAEIGYQESIPIIATTESVTEITKADGSIPVLLTSDQIGSFSDSAKPDSLALETSVKDFPVSVNFLVLTSFITGETGTGKVWILPIEAPSNTYLLLEGFQVPLSVCFDSRHLLLYIIDQGSSVSPGSIFQYRLDYKELLELSSDIYVSVYTGHPSDCKVDSYGNLYFTDSFQNTISFISYPDLFSGFSNKHLTIYSKTRSFRQVNGPARLDFSASQSIFFVNNNIGSGTLNLASSEVESLNEEAIITVAQHEIKAWGVAYGENRVFYSLDNGDVRVFDLRTEEDSIFISGVFIDPRGLCVADHRLFVADHGKGGVYWVDLETAVPVLLASIQAVDGLHCLSTAVIFIVTLSFNFIL